jgi:YVTN family beta-propeller protein
MTQLRSVGRPSKGRPTRAHENVRWEPAAADPVLIEVSSAVSHTHGDGRPNWNSIQIPVKRMTRGGETNRVVRVCSAFAVMVAAASLSACTTSGSVGARTPVPSLSPRAVVHVPTPAIVPSPTDHAPGNVYAAIRSKALAPAVRGIAPRVYVPDNDSNDVRVIDPRSFRVIRVIQVGAEPQHISPSWDLRHLYVGNVYGNSLTELDARTGRVVRTISVPDPYNLYFTPDGRHAIDVAEGRDTLYFYDARTWKPQGSLHIPFRGPDHLDFSRDGRYVLISTEYAGVIVKVGTRPWRTLGALSLGGSLVDVKLAPDGRVFYVANQERGGVSLIDPIKMREVAFIPTGSGAHGFAIARDGIHLYVSNRLAGSISVLDTRTRRVVHTWPVGGSPDMLQVSMNGNELWASNRFDSSVSVVDTRSGRVIKVIDVGGSPHGLTLFPQPGRYSLGHNGVYR